MVEVLVRKIRSARIFKYDAIVPDVSKIPLSSGRTKAEARQGALEAANMIRKARGLKPF
jgi:hypothetical protein